MSEQGALADVKNVIRRSEHHVGIGAEKTFGWHRLKRTDKNCSSIAYRDVQKMLSVRQELWKTMTHFPWLQRGSVSFLSAIFRPYTAHGAGAAGTKQNHVAGAPAAP